MNAVIISVSRDDYSAKESAQRTMTVGELICELEQYDEDDKVIVSHDNGYTYGRLSSIRIDWKNLDEPEEDEEEY